MPISFHNAITKLGEIIHKHQVGIYVTIIFHLCVLILLMSVKLHAVITRAPLYIEIDYSQEEEQRMLEELQREKLALERQVNQMLGHEREHLRNVAVNEEWEEDESERDKVFDENEELQRKIEATREMLKQNDAGDAPVEAKKTDKKKELYTGPSVMSYKLEGRKAYSLPVPVYKCENGGTVVVNIVVAQRGSVVATSIDEPKSAADICLHDAAKRAAMLSKFSVSESSKNQQGTITYRFVAQ